MLAYGRTIYFQILAIEYNLFVTEEEKEAIPNILGG